MPSTTRLGTAASSTATNSLPPESVVEYASTVGATPTTSIISPSDSASQVHGKRSTTRAKKARQYDVDDQTDLDQSDVENELRRSRRSWRADFYAGYVKAGLQRDDDDRVVYTTTATGERFPNYLFKCKKCV
jgi:hypothetical protein